MECKECIFAKSCVQDKAFCEMDLIDAISEMPYMIQDNPSIVEQYIKNHGYTVDMARERDKTVIAIVLVDGVPVQTPKWLEEIMEKARKAEECHVEVPLQNVLPENFTDTYRKMGEKK